MIDLSHAETLTALLDDLEAYLASDNASEAIPAIVRCIGDLRDTVAAMRRERDNARRVGDALDERLKKALRERDEARAQIEAWKPVVEAARAVKGIYVGVGAELMEVDDLCEAVRKMQENSPDTKAGAS